MTKDNIKQYIGHNFIFFSVILISLFLLFRNIGIYPVVMGDEYTYSLFSRLLPFADATRPGYLYSLIYHVTNFCGDGFYSCAKILNTFFFIGAAPFIYLITKRVSTNSLALIITLLTLLGPINSYTAYFMPEAFYFFSFWLFVWFILKLDNLSSSRSWCVGGIILGLSALIKPHALFLLPAIIIYIFYINKKRDDKWVIQAFKNIGLFIILTFFIKLFIGYLIAGKTGITVLGNDYSTIVSSNISGFQHYFELIRLSAINIKGHILAVCLMFSVPIIIIINQIFNFKLIKQENREFSKIYFFTIAILINLILITAAFSASVIGNGPGETIARLHMRYYDFALPLLLVVLASQLSFESTNSKTGWRLLTALPIGGIMLYATYTKMAPFILSFIDNPELRGFTYNSIVFYILSSISFISLILWIYRAQLGAKFFIYLFMPVTIIASTFFVSHEMRRNLIPDVYDNAGIFTKQYLNNDEISKVLIIGSEPAGLLKALFHLDNPQSSIKVIPTGSIYDLSNLPHDKEWVLNIGNNKLPKNNFDQIKLGGYTLTHATSTNIIDLKKSTWPGIISSIKGLSHSEPWGTWSTADEVIFEFLNPLPEKFTVRITAGAFGPNVGEDFIIQVGNNSTKFKLTSLPEEKIFNFNSPGGNKEIKIKIPSPISPKKLGINDDERNLGIGFIKLEITAQ